MHTLFCCIQTAGGVCMVQKRLWCVKRTSCAVLLQGTVASCSVQ